MSRKQILFLARWYPDRHDNMLGLFVQKHAVAVQALHNVSVVYVTADSTITAGSANVDVTHFNGIREVRIYFGKSGFAPLDAWRYFKWYLHGIRLCKTPDLIHVHILTRTALAAFWLKVTRGIPYIITEHWSRYLPENVAKGSYKGILRRFITRLVVSRAGAVTTVTRNLANAMQRLKLNNTFYITPNVVDVSKFFPAADKKESPGKTLVHVSCFDEPAKNVKGIIDAVKQLATVRTDFNLILVGDGKDFSEVHNYAKLSGMEGNRIRFTGLLEGENLTQVMRDADAMVMFSNYENLPCTIVESMASGVPVISTDVGGIREHLLPAYGTLIPRGDVDALKERLTELLDGTATFDKAGMRNYALEHFSNEAIGKQFHSIYIESGLTGN